LKRAVFHAKALQAIRAFPLEVRRELGKAIYDLQNGESFGMPLSRPMNSLGRGAEELRVRDRSGVYRVFYCARLIDRILIFHAFQKRTQATPQAEIELGRKRLKELLNEKV